KAGDGADAHAGLRERLRSIYGGEQKLIAVDHSARFEIEDNDEEEETGAEDGRTHATIRIWGFMGAPGVSRSTRDEQHLFVNRRPVENRGLNFALLEGYHTMLMKGRYPLCCLFLELSPALVDVNIHPAKREVKFREEQTIRKMVTEAVRQALVNYHAKAEVARPVVPPPSRVSTADFQLKTPEPVPETRTFPNFVPPTPSSPIPKWPRPSEPP